jgi:hypothetical protein
MKRQSMTRRGAICTLALVALLEPRLASASGPGFPDFTVPAQILLVGHVGGTPDPAGTFEVIVRGFDNEPIPGAYVIVDFTEVLDARLASDVSSAGITVDCQQKWAWGLTDAQGRVTMSIVGAAQPGSPQCFPSGAACDGRARIYADGVLIGFPYVAMVDLDGASGVAGGDLSAWLDDFGTSLHPTRSDFDGDGNVGGGDLALWLTFFGANASQQSGTPYCP